MVAPILTAITDSWPLGKPYAGIFGDMFNPLSFAGTFADRAVTLDLFGDCGRSAAEVTGDRAYGLVFVHGSLNGHPLCLSDPEILPLLLSFHLFPFF